MILITGSILATPDTIDELTRLGVEHSQRSREEPGCEHHACHVDAENPLRIVFMEYWTDRTAVQAHFALPSARGFVGAARKLAAEPPVIKIYSSEELNFGL